MFCRVSSPQSVSETQTVESRATKIRLSVSSQTRPEKKKRGCWVFFLFFWLFFFFKINKWGGCVVRQEHISSLGVENFPSAGFSAKMRNTETLLDKRTSVKKAELSNLLRRVLKS